MVTYFEQMRSSIKDDTFTLDEAASIQNNVVLDVAKGVIVASMLVMIIKTMKLNDNQKEAILSISTAL